MAAGAIARLLAMAGRGAAKSAPKAAAVTRFAGGRTNPAAVSQIIKARRDRFGRL